MDKYNKSISNNGKDSKNAKNIKNSQNALLFHMEDAKAEKLSRVLARLGIAVRRVEPEEYGLPLGLLAGLPGSFLLAGRDRIFGSGAEGAFGPKEAEVDQEMLVFSGLTGRELDRALSSMRGAGVSGIALKAVLTETNRFWNARQLIWELKREHEAMRKGPGE